MISPSFLVFFLIGIINGCTKMAPHVVEGDGFGPIYLCGGNMLLQKK
jgi:hypothetical protein